MSISPPPTTVENQITPPSLTSSSLRPVANLSGFISAGFGAAGLLSLIEWVDMNGQLTPVFASMTERLIFTVYFSLNLLSGALIGFIVGLAFHLGNIIQATIAEKISRGLPRRWHHLLTTVIVCGLFAFLLNQQWHAHRLALSLIREAEKIGALNSLLLNHERSTSYLFLLSFILTAVILRWVVVSLKSASRWLKLSVIALLALAVAGFYYADSRIEPLLYEHSFHYLMFVLANFSAFALVASVYGLLPQIQKFQNRLQPAKQRTLIFTAVFILGIAILFTLVYFNHHQNLKVQLFSRTTQAKKHFQMVQWAVDFDRDGYSPILGGGDLNDSNPDINPGRHEILSDGADNNCIGGDLTYKSLKRWHQERESFYLAPHANARKLNVIYIFIDALRPDRLGAYGYHKNTSPNIDKLASYGTVFENAFTPAPNTFEALPKFMQSAYWDAQLPDWSVTLSQNGYECWLFPRRIVTLLRHVKGMKVAPRAPDGRFSGSIDTAIDVLGKIPNAQPFAAYLYATDPHRPYRQHQGFEFGKTDSDHYDSEIAYDDFHLGRLFDWLEQSGRLKDTMILIMADHGESLGERGVLKHSSQLYNEQARIPMIIYHPDIQPRRVADYVSSIDLGTTILNAVGLHYPKEAAGVSLIPLMRGEPFVHPPIFGEQTTEEDSPYLPPEKNLVQNGKKYMVITQDGFKLIFNRDYYAFELFNLKTDPREEHNLYQSHPEKAAELQEILGRFIDVVLVSRPADADEKQYRFGPTRGREDGESENDNE
ncbi:MAG: sulfatase-like hydrolase/transferase [Acidobacteriota bacterium]